MSQPTANIWFPFMIGDHLGRTQHLNPSEEAAYVRLQCYQWQHGHFEEQRIPLIGRFSDDAWSMSRASIMQMLSIDDAGLCFIPWMETDKAKWAEKQRKAVEKARKAANSRWANTKRKDGKDRGNKMLQALPEHSSSTATPDAPHMPFTFTASTTPPSPSVQGEAPRRAAGERGAKTPKTPAVASPDDQATQPASSASGGAVVERSGPLGIDSAHPLVQSAERRKPTIGDSRFLPFKGVVVKWWGQANEVDPKRAPWTGRTNAALKTMLEAEPELTIEELVDRLGHRWQAMQICLEHPTGRGAVLPATPLHQVLARLETFRHGPVTDLGDKL